MKSISTFIAAVLLVSITIVIGIFIASYFSGLFTSVGGGATGQQVALQKCMGAAAKIDSVSVTGGSLTSFTVTKSSNEVMLNFTFISADNGKINTTLTPPGMDKNEYVKTVNTLLDLSNANVITVGYTCDFGGSKVSLTLEARKGIVTGWS